MAKTARSTIKSAQRTLAVFEFFGEQKRAASVSEISNALHIPQSSASVLLRSLLSLGYLEYSADTRKFRPTYRVVLLGSWLSSSLFDRGPITNVAEAIGRETKETVALGLQNGPHLQYVHIVKSSEPVQLAIQLGTLRPLTWTAMGHMLLSTVPDSEIRPIIRRNNAEAMDDAHRISERELMAEIEQIRRYGYVERRGKVDPDAKTIAMLVPLQPDVRPIAIGVGGPMKRVEARRELIFASLRRHLGL